MKGIKRPVLPMTAVSGLFSLALAACSTAYSASFAAEVAAGYPADKPFPNSVFMSVEGASMHVRVFPCEGAPRGHVLFVHGLAGSTFCWRHLAPALANEGFLCVAVDVPPFGYSSKRDELPKDDDSRAALLWSTVDRLFPEARWILVGHSLGGAYCAVMAARRPEKVTDLVLFAPAIREGSIREGASTNPAIPESVLGWAMKEPWLMNILLGSAYGRQPLRSELAGYMGPFLSEEAAEGFIEWAAGRGSASSGIGPIDTRCLLIWGDRDAWVPLSGAETVMTAIPGSRLVIARGEGHCPMETAPSFSIDAIMDFLEQASRARLSRKTN